MMMTESLYQLRGFFRCVRIPEDTFVEPQLITIVQMDKSKNLFFAFIALAAVSCAPNTDNNHGLEYDSLEVNFSASKSGDGWAADDVVGIKAVCTRDGQEDFLMSTNNPACFSPVAAGESSYLVKNGEDNNIIALAGDHNFRFYAYTPYDASITDLSQLPADIPANVTYGEPNTALYVASANVTDVVAPVALDFTSISCCLNLQIPDDIVAESSTVLRKMVIKSSEDAPLEDDIAYSAAYNIYTGDITRQEGSGSKEITVDFGQDGCTLEPGYTALSVLIAPFTVPEGGLRVEFTDINGDTNTVPLLQNNSGESYTAGADIDFTLSSSSDGIVPCTSPVEWPVGYRDGVGVFNNTTQPLWLSEHIWTSSQSQATMTYVVSENNPVTPKFESNNFTQYNYSSGCVKGSWTGDYFEFDVPVRRFEAGTEVTLTFPAYGRGAPLYWDVYYLDGEEWKCDRSSHTSPDGQFTQNSTLMIEHGNRDGSFEGITYEVKMTFENAIQSGHLRIRLQVAYGQYITNNSPTYSTACKEISTPSLDGKMLFAFVNKSGDTNSVKIEW